MAASDPTRVILEVEHAADPIAGVAVRADGTSRSFRGWTALADAVAAALDEDGPQALDRTGGTDPGGEGHRG